MIIKWLGHSCFRLILSSGLSIVTDPYDAQVGYPMPVHGAEIVTVSHEHYDHNFTRPHAPAHVLRGVGLQTVGDVSVQGFSAFHDEVKGAKRGLNTLFLIEADGVRVLHLGDLGHDLTDEQITALGRVDVLLIPVGGVYTIDAAQAAALSRRVNARITVPMHFKTPFLTFALGECAPFIEAVGPAKTLAQLDPHAETASVVVLTPGQGL